MTGQIFGKLIQAQQRGAQGQTAGRSELIRSTHADLILLKYSVYQAARMTPSALRHNRLAKKAINQSITAHNNKRRSFFLFQGNARMMNMPFIIWLRLHPPLFHAATHNDPSSGAVDASPGRFLGGAAEHTKKQSEWDLRGI